MKGFTEEELKLFCYDFYRDIYDALPSSSTKIGMAHQITEYNERRNILSKLVQFIKEERPDLFDS